MSQPLDLKLAGNIPDHLGVGRPALTPQVDEAVPAEQSQLIKDRTGIAAVFRVAALEVHLLRQRLGIGLEDVLHQRFQIIIAGTLQKLAGIADIDAGHYSDSLFCWQAS